MSFLSRVVILRCLRLSDKINQTFFKKLIKMLATSAKTWYPAIQDAVPGFQTSVVSHCQE